MGDDGSGSGSCLVWGFGVVRVEPSGSAVGCSWLSFLRTLLDRDVVL